MWNDLPDHWSRRPIGEIAKVIGGGTPKTKVESYWDGGVPWISPKDLSSHQDRYIERGERDISLEGQANSSARFLPPGAVLVSSRAPIGYVAIARQRLTTNQGFRSLVLMGNHVPEYFYYVLKASTPLLEARANGSTFKEISGSSLKQVELPVPPVNEQRRIAAVLGALDDKIELNRRMNRTLEALAQALFRRRFVTFDDRGDLMDSGTDLGEIPEGWEVGPFSHLATLRMKTIQPKDAPEAVWEHFSIPAYDAGERPAMERGDTIKSGKYRVPESAVLASKLNPRFPRVWLPDVQRPDVAICSTEFMPFVPKRPEWRPFLYSMIRSKPFQQAIQTRATGTTPSRQRVRPTTIAKMPVLIPPPEEIDEFSREAGPLQERRLANLRQNDTLAELRDALLPELISGRLRVPEGAVPTEPA